MRRAIPAILLACILGSVAGPGFAFEVQSGGVLLSAQSVAMMANRLATRPNSPANPLADPLTAKAATPSGSTMNMPLANGATRDERMMELMLGGRPGTQAGARAGAAPNGTTGVKVDSLADLKAALRNRR